MTTITRGATVIFTATFTAIDGTPYEPATARLYINYPIGRSRGTAIIEMTSGADSWTATWESAGSGPGSIFYSIRTTTSIGAPEIVAKDGSFSLSANAANP